MIQPRKRRASRLPFVPLPRLLAFVLLSAIPLALATFYEPLAWGAVAIWAAAIVLALIDARATRPLTADDVSRQIIEQKSARYQRLLSIRLRPPAQVYAEKPSIYFPTEMYDSYAASYKITACSRRA